MVENWDLVLEHPVTRPDHISSASLKTRIISCEKFSHSESDISMIEISYSIPLSAYHSAVSFHIEFTIRSRIQTERNQTRDTKQLTASKILISIVLSFYISRYIILFRKYKVTFLKAIVNGNMFFLNKNRIDTMKLFLILHTYCHVFSDCRRVLDCQLDLLHTSTNYN
jgi:hypothetical protein